MNKNHRSHLRKHYKHYLLGIFILVVLIFGGGWWLAEHYKPILSQKLKKKVYIASDSLYHLHFSEIQIHPILGNLTIDSLHLIPDTTVFNRLKEKHQAPNHLFDVFVAEFKIRNLHLLSLFFQKEIEIKKVIAENPDIFIQQQAQSDSTSKSEPSKSIRQTILQSMSGTLKKIQIDELGLHDASLHYKKNKKVKSGKLSLHRLDLTFKDIKIDSNTAKKPSRLLFAKNIILQVGRSLYFTPDSLYKITTGEINFSLDKGSIADFKLIPRDSKQEFSRQFKYRQDRFKISLDSLAFSRLSLDDRKKRRWHFGKFEIKNADIDIYLDAALLIEKVGKPLPQNMLRKIGINLLIDTVDLKNVNIKYSERNPDTKKVGYVTFNQIHGNLENITNDSVQIRNNKYASAKLDATFMGKAKLHTFFRFNLEKLNNPFSYKGHLSYLNAAVLNPATMPLGMVKIKKGEIRSLDYNMNANEAGATGRVALKYDDLKVKILSKDDQTGDLKKQNLLSLAANLLVVKKSNVQNNHPSQHTSVHYKRDKYRSVFNLMWKSIFSGVKPLVGVDKKTQKGIKSLQSIKKEVKGGK